MDLQPEVWTWQEWPVSGPEPPATLWSSSQANWPELPADGFGFLPGDTMTVVDEKSNEGSWGGRDSQQCSCDREVQTGSCGGDCSCASCAGGQGAISSFPDSNEFAEVSFCGPSATLGYIGCPGAYIPPQVYVTASEFSSGPPSDPGWFGTSASSQSAEQLLGFETLPGADDSPGDPFPVIAEDSVGAGVATPISLLPWGEGSGAGAAAYDPWEILKRKIRYIYKRFYELRGQAGVIDDWLAHCILGCEVCALAGGTPYGWPIEIFLSIGKEVYGYFFQPPEFREDTLKDFVMDFKGLQCCGDVVPPVAPPGRPGSLTDQCYVCCRKLCPIKPPRSQRRKYK